VHSPRGSICSESCSEEEEGSLSCCLLLLLLLLPLLLAPAVGAGLSACRKFKALMGLLMKPMMPTTSPLM
jgi:hypothetical protein